MIDIIVIYTPALAQPTMWPCLIGEFTVTMRIATLAGIPSAIGKLRGPVCIEAPEGRQGRT